MHLRSYSSGSTTKFLTWAWTWTWMWWLGCPVSRSIWQEGVLTELLSGSSIVCVSSTIFWAAYNVYNHVIQFGLPLICQQANTCYLCTVSHISSLSLDRTSSFCTCLLHVYL